MDIKERLEKHYSGYDEDGRLMSKYGRVEFLTTLRYIDKYIGTSEHVLEIGAATGRYSHTLARRGNPVDAIELLECNIEKFNDNTLPCEKVKVTQGNALDLSFIRDNTYDAVLLLGPMYHLYTGADQRQALKEAIRVCRPGGYIFVAYVGHEGCVIQHGFCNEQLLRQKHYQDLIEPMGFKLKSPEEETFVLYRIEDINALNEGLPVQRLHLVGTDMFTNYIREDIKRMDTSLYDRYLQYHFAICERPEIIGVSDHYLDVLRKL